MRLIDEIHLRWPLLSSRRIRDELRDLGHNVGRGHVSTLMRKMGLEAIYCKPRATRPQPGNKTYPYLLRNMEINRANHVLAAEITYLSVAKVFCYLVAIMGWASRCVLAWRLSNTMDVLFCLDALEEPLANFGPSGILNTDQGSQFASEAFTDMLGAQGAKISMKANSSLGMDGKRRWMDNALIERL